MPLNAAARLSWRERRVAIADQSLRDVVVELVRHRVGAIVVLGEAAKLRVSGVFDRHGHRRN
jgi:ferric-dicitrate binding protein FerR (iron transport regulator)